MTTILEAQLEAATGLFSRMNSYAIAVDPEVFTMFGIMLGALKASLTANQIANAAVNVAGTLSDAEIAELARHCTGLHQTMTNGDVIMRLIATVRAARRERDDYGAEIRRMCGTMTPEEVHTENRHRAEIDLVDRTVEHRTAGAIADWVERELDVGPLNPYTEKQRVVDGIRALAWKPVAP